MKVSIKTVEGLEIEVESADNTLTDVTGAALTLLRATDRPVRIPAPFGFSLSADTERTERVPDLIEAPCLD